MMRSVVDFSCIMNRWDNHFRQLYNELETNGFRQTEIHTAEPLLLEGSTLKFVMVAEKLQNVQIPRY